MLSKVLYSIFKRQFLKMYHLDQPKIGFDRMEKAFVDSNGMIYYRCVRDLDLPMERFRRAQRQLQLIKAGLSEDSLSLIVKTIITAINGGKRPDVAEIGFLVKEMDKRIGVLVDPEALFDSAAIMYIREDESPIVIDQAIHKQKIEQFKLDSQGGLYDFFYSTGLTAFIPFVGITESEFEEYLKESEIKMKALTMHMQKYITESESSNQ